MTTMTRQHNPGTNFGTCLNAWCETRTTRDLHGLCQSCQPPAPTRSEIDEAIADLTRSYDRPRSKPAPRTVIISPLEHAAATRMLNRLTEQEHTKLISRGQVPKTDEWSTKFAHSSTRYPTFLGGMALAIARGHYTIRKAH